MEAFCTKQTSTFYSLIAVTWEVHPKGSLRTHRQTSQTTKHNILSKQLKEASIYRPWRPLTLSYY